MDVKDVPMHLAERLGPDATADLVQLLNETFGEQRDQWSEQVLSLAVERFERRLTEETSKLRVEMTEGFAGLEVRLMREISANRVEALRWSFAFWIGQLVAMAGLLAFMLRGVRG